MDKKLTPDKLEHGGWGFLFTLGRSEGYPSQYGEQHTPAHIDVPTAGIVTVISILAISFFSILPAYGKQKRWSLFLRISTSLFVGGVILVGNYGHNWETAKARITAPYKPSNHEEIKGTIGLHITLRGINVTLKGEPKRQNETSLAGERIDYNERFTWQWAQGRFGFGYYAGQISKDYRSALERGVPLPILQIAEYFTFDGEGIRFGRLAGWYSHILMWASFGTWLITNILFFIVISSAIYFLMLTGLLQLFAIGIWTTLRNPMELAIPFESADDHKDIQLKTNFGLDFYLVFVNGILCIVLGLLLLILNALKPDEMCTFFGVDPLTIYEELILNKDELETARSSAQDEGNNLIKMGTFSISTDPDTCADDVPSTSGQTKKISFEDPDNDSPGTTLVLRRKEDTGSALFRKSFLHKPKPKPRFRKEEDRGVQTPLLKREDTYENVEAFAWPPPPREIRAPTLPPKTNPFRRQ